MGQEKMQQPRANSPMQAGKEARQKLGFWHANRFLLLRRASQLAIMLMFLSGPFWNLWILKGNYSGSVLFDLIPMSDPLMTAESLATGYLPHWKTLLGAVIVVLFYALVASKAFCGWVCPLNIVTDLAAWLRRKLGIRHTMKLSRQLRYVLLGVILLGSSLTGTLIWEWINPVAALGRAFVFGLGATVWLVLAVFLFDLLVAEHGWCGHLCPIGASYALIGAKSVLRVKVIDRARCDRCMDCYHVCPEPQVLRTPLHGSEQESTIVLSKDCISCGRCIDVCAENVFAFGTRFQGSIEVKNISS
ncbi:quinol dehydrogenase ferredoxin subunit NapH [Pasteurellaceae bacterium Macca]|nr:quinol dehydrogenase ferredoxin subunit NapH [Pasteurellaceae bacterium Macca]